MPIQPTLLSVAGSDPTGGAGIQADLKTMTAIGVYGAAAISCLTIQNSRGVRNIQALAPDFVQAQIEAVLEDHSVTHIKIGMLGTLEIAQKIHTILKGFTGTVVYDPVLAASTGESLLTGSGLQFLKEHFLMNISFLTPNVSELEQLSGGEIATTDDGIVCAKLLLANYPEMKAVVVKGGHLESTRDTISDFLVMNDGSSCESKRKRVRNSNLHGTGCTYSSALASFLCLGNDPESAFIKAGAFMDKIIRSGVNVQLVKENVNGPLLHYLASVMSD